jgi:pantoate--beta-alanine ligase
MIVTRTVADVRRALADLPRPAGLVPTMGALHEGHLALVRAARERSRAVVASLFVNPSQFAPGEDFARYPRDEERDLGLFERTGVDVVFAPVPDEMYPEGFRTVVHVGGPLTEKYEAEERLSHFDGVATIVTKLFTIVAPDVAFFGEKDAQQLALIRRVARDLDLPVEVAGVPTVREPDGLAMSSRNAYLSPRERAVAADLYRALLAGRAAALKPAGTPKDAIVAAATALVVPDDSLLTEEERRQELTGRELARPPRFTIDYLDVVDADTFEQTRRVTPRALFIAAGRLGGTRLLDNIWLAPARSPLGRAMPAEQAVTTSASPAGEPAPAPAPSVSPFSSPSTGAYPVGGRDLSERKG